MVTVLTLFAMVAGWPFGRCSGLGGGALSATRRSGVVATTGASLATAGDTTASGIADGAGCSGVVPDCATRAGLCVHGAGEGGTGVARLAACGRWNRSSAAAGRVLGSWWCNHRLSRRRRRSSRRRSHWCWCNSNRWWKPRPSSVLESLPMGRTVGGVATDGAATVGAGASAA